MIIRIVRVEALIVLLVCAMLAGCASTQSMTLADGSQHSFAFGNGLPEPVENDWLKMATAGPTVSRHDDGQEPTVRWTFGFQPRTGDLTAITVDDVTEAPVRTVVRDAPIVLHKGFVFVHSEPISLQSDEAAWMRSGRDSLHVFRLRLSNSQGATRTLYQPVKVSRQFKQTLSAFVGQVEVEKTSPHQHAGWRFDLDMNVWHVGHRQSIADAAITEYVPIGETVNNWTRMVTVTSNRLSREQLADPAWLGRLLEEMRKGLARNCATLQWKILRESATDVIYEWRHDGCQGYKPLHEIARLTRTPIGFARLAYVVKQSPMSDGDHERWLKVISEAELAIQTGWQGD